MNTIQSLIDRQLGISCHFNYDSILRRLVVDADESFYGLQSSAAGAGAVLEADPPIFACRFAETAGYEHILALANEDGRVAIQNTCSPRTARELEGFQCHNNAVFDLAWMPGQMNFVTVSGDHTAALWDVGTGAPQQSGVFSHHSRSVKTAAFRPGGGGVFATGARDGHVLLWDARAAPRPALVLRPDDRLAACHASFTPKTPGSHGKRPRHERRAISITGLAFRDERTLLSCGECDGNIKVWDMRKSYSACTREPLPWRAIPYAGASAKRGYTCLVVDAARMRLYASCMDDVIYCFNLATYSAAPERRYVGHENATFYIKASLSPDRAYLVSGSSDKHAYVWHVRSAEPVARLAGHRAEVTCAAWAQAGDPKVVTCSDDARHMIWRIGREELDPDERVAGRAERAPCRERAAPPQWGAPERTPTSLKRRAPAERPPAPSGPRRTKRCLADLMNAADAGGACKRPRLEAEERLLPAGSKRRLSETSSSGYIADPASWGYVSSPPGAGASFMTPTKNYSAASAARMLSPRGAAEGTPPKVRALSPRGGVAAPEGTPPKVRALSPRGAVAAPEVTPPKVRALSPRALVAPEGTPPKVRVLSWGTPTRDLPDFVCSGEAPHLRLMSPERKRPERHNWLTQLGRERRGERPPDKLPPPSDKPGSPSSCKENVPAPARRGSLSERAPRPGKKPRTLLKYFQVAARKD